MTEETDDERDPHGDRIAARKRYNMKALGRLVDSNRLTGVSRPTEAVPDRLETVASSIDDTDRILAVADRMNIPIRLAGNGGAAVATDVVARDRADGGVDLFDGAGVGARSAVAVRLDDSPRGATDLERGSTSSLARRMLDGEIGPGGRISDPRDVPGIVLDLAKDVPASVAVSVVRIDEEIEIVGDSIDPTIDPGLFTAAFSGVFRSVRPAAQALQEGPLGPIRDVVIEGERMDLILRPLGHRYFLMVLEDRNDPQANLAATRMRMASIAPGVTAILAQQDGEV